jgi:serine/threonine-protein phosphatase PGAM5
MLVSAVVGSSLCTTGSDGEAPVLDIEQLSPIPYHTLYLIRHGQYERSMAAAEPGDGPLTALGREQADQTGRRLSAFVVDVIHHSTLIRATETAQIIAAHFPGVELRATPLLKECAPTVAPAVRALLGESVTEADLRRSDAQARRVFRQWFQPLAADATQGSREIVVSSGNLISYLVSRTLGASGRQWIHTTIQHCGISEVLLGGDRERLLLRHNDTGHLPGWLQTI